MLEPGRRSVVPELLQRQPDPPLTVANVECPAAPEGACRGGEFHREEIAIVREQRVVPASHGLQVVLRRKAPLGRNNFHDPRGGRHVRRHRGNRGNDDPCRVDHPERELEREAAAIAPSRLVQATKAVNDVGVNRTRHLGRHEPRDGVPVCLQERHHHRCHHHGAPAVPDRVPGAADVRPRAHPVAPPRPGRRRPRPEVPV